MSVMLVFKDHEGDNFMLSFPAAENDVPMKLKLWVAYEKGGTCNSTFQRIKRGYYLYVSVEETSSMARVMTASSCNSRVFLGEVKRRSEKSCREFSEKAGNVAEDIVKQICKDSIIIDWDNCTAIRWSGKRNRLGMYSEMYDAIYPDSDE